MSTPAYTVAAFVREFDWAVTDFYAKHGRRFENFPRGASGYFHQRAIEVVRQHGAPPSTWIASDGYFIELLYAMLAAWGMDGQSARLADFPEFRQAVIHLAHSPAFGTFELRALHSVDEKSKDALSDLWRTLTDEARIMASESLLVGSSKLLHHLLPDLFPPIDRTYTLPFLRHLDKSEPYCISGSECQWPDFETFYKAMLFFGHVSRSVPGIGAYVNKGVMSGSIPKVIDNAVIVWWDTD